MDHDKSAFSKRKNLAHKKRSNYLPSHEHDSDPSRPIMDDIVWRKNSCSLSLIAKELLPPKSTCENHSSTSGTCTIFKCKFYSRIFVFRHRPLVKESTTSPRGAPRPGCGPHSVVDHVLFFITPTPTTKTTDTQNQVGMSSPCSLYLFSKYLSSWSPSSFSMGFVRGLSCSLWRTPGSPPDEPAAEVWDCARGSAPIPLVCGVYGAAVACPLVARAGGGRIDAPDCGGDDR